MQHSSSLQLQYLELYMWKNDKTPAAEYVNISGIWNTSKLSFIMKNARNDQLKIKKNFT